MMYDCAIIGGGPAGLNAALVLGRARRRVALLDNNQPRNSVTHASHGFITRDNVAPAEFRRVAYEEVLRYPSVHHWQLDVTDVHAAGQGFDIVMSSGNQLQARKVIIATGLKEIFPAIEGFHDFYGKSIFNCPYCDAWEMRDQPLIAISEDAGIFHTAKLLYNWSEDLIVSTNGRTILSDEQQDLLMSRGIRVIQTPIAAFEGQHGQLERVSFTDGSWIERRGGFVSPTFVNKATFREQLGYEVTEQGGIRTDAAGRSSVAGLYAAGDAAYVRPSQVVIAAAAGSKVAMTVNYDLTEEDF
ncbi:NAD(P)/FAD-dependent oxidoreductase [Paenibacillus guangzhouensis]|uniref:NAD(P)/FAD-dependent oxidoreductase n=1 Tax=Paenibacillus guangzhouensis TaxID=1473112 RepID=UPI001266BE99|nr:NAD(P)/FAD-dependent oxidoreductase [Paenibacillus guangzhouensis]